LFTVTTARVFLSGTNTLKLLKPDNFAKHGFFYPPLANFCKIIYNNYGNVTNLLRKAWGKDNEN
jgi:hypothetical protein